MSKQLEISIISPEAVIFSGEAASIVLPGVQSSFAVLPGHTALVAELEPGLVQIRTASGEKTVMIDGGFAEVQNDKVNLLVEGSVDMEKIDLNSEKNALNELLGKVIPPLKRYEIENQLKQHRSRIAVASKK